MAQDINIAGCYAIIHKESKSVYIGESLSLFKRYNDHVQNLYNGTHHCPKLMDLFKTSQGIKDFTFKPLYIITKKLKPKNLKVITLYLEAAYFFKYKQKGINILNHIDPLNNLLENEFIEFGKSIIKTGNILELLYEDKYSILTPEELENIKSYIENNNKNIKNNNKNIERNCPYGTKLQDLQKWNLTPDEYKENIIKTYQMKQNNEFLLPLTKVHDYINIKHPEDNSRILLNNINFIKFGEYKQVIPTQFSLDNNYIQIGKPSMLKEGDKKYLRFILYCTKEGLKYVKSKL